MFAKDDKKKAVSIIIAKAGKPSMPEGPEEDKDEGPEDMEGMKTAAEEIMSAIDAKDADALAQALKSFYEMC